LRKGQLFRAIQKGGKRVCGNTSIHCIAGVEAKDAPFKCTGILKMSNGHLQSVDALDCAGEERIFASQFWNFVPVK